MAEKKKKLWDNYRVIGAVRKSEKLKIVVTISCKDGVRYISLREFYYNNYEQEWRATKNGITIPLKVPINKAETMLEPFPTVLGVIHQAIDELVKMPLEDENNAVYIEKKWRIKTDDKN